MRLGVCVLSLAVDLADRGQGLVPGGLGLRAGGAEDLLCLLLGRLHAVGGGAIGLGDPLAPALLGALAQLSGGALRRLEDAGDTGWCAAQVDCAGAPGGLLSRGRGIGIARTWG